MASADKKRKKTVLPKHGAKKKSVITGKGFEARERDSRQPVNLKIAQFAGLEVDPDGTGLIVYGATEDGELAMRLSFAAGFRK